MSNQDPNTFNTVSGTEFKLPTSFVVDRSKWFRGRGPGRSALLCPPNWVGDSLAGQRCCVGFLASACGIPDDELRGRRVLFQKLYHYDEEDEYSVATIDDDIDNDKGALASKLLDILDDAYSANDARDLPEADRELEITRLMAQLGVTVTFVDGPV